MTHTPEDVFVWARDVTALLGVPTSTIRRWIAEGIVTKADDGKVSWWDCVEAAYRPKSTEQRHTVNRPRVDNTHPGEHYL